MRERISARKIAVEYHGHRAHQQLAAWRHGNPLGIEPPDQIKRIESLLTAGG